MDIRLPAAGRPIPVLAGCLPLLLLIGWVDYVTGPELNAVVLYLLPVVLASWWGPPAAGYAIAFLAALVWCVAARAPAELHSSRAMLYLTRRSSCWSSL